MGMLVRTSGSCLDGTIVKVFWVKDEKMVAPNISGSQSTFGLSLKWREGHSKKIVAENRREKLSSACPIGFEA